jgi:hypothetical protein
VTELLQLDLADACVKSCDLAERKLVVIDQKMAELAAIRRALAKLMAECDKKSRRAPFPIIAALQREPGQRWSLAKGKCLELADIIDFQQNLPHAAKVTEPLNDIFFKWEAGPPSSRIIARLHHPENRLHTARNDSPPFFKSVNHRALE